MKLDTGISSAVQKELESKLLEERAHKQEVYGRLKRLRKYRRKKKCITMRLFHTIVGCTKCQ